MKKMTRLNIALTHEQKLWLAEKAQEYGSTCTGVIRDLIRTAMNGSNNATEKSR